MVCQLLQLTISDFKSAFKLRSCAGDLSLHVCADLVILASRHYGVWCQEAVLDFTFAEIGAQRFRDNFPVEKVGAFGASMEARFYA